MLDVLRRSGRPLLWAVLFSAVVALAVFVRSSALDPVYVSTVEVKAVPGDPQATTAEALAERASAAVDGGAARDVNVRGDRLVLEVTASEADQAAKAAEAVAASVGDTIATGSLRRLDADVADQQAAIADLQARVAAAPADQRPGLEAQLSAATETLLALQATPPDRLELVRRATVPRAAESPRPVRDAGTGFAVALLLSSVVALAVVVRADRFVRGRLGADVAKQAEAPLLAVVAGDGDERQEAVAAVRGALLLLPELDRLRTLAVVSPDAGDAASELVLSLSRSVATLGVPVCVVDANLRGPRQHAFASLPREPGLTDALRDHSDSLDAAKDASGVAVVPAGAAVADPMALLTGGTLKPLLESPEAELVVVDTAPAKRYPDAVAVAPACDATLLVIDPRRSRRRDLADLARQLRLVGARVVGVVAVVPAETAAAA